MIVVVVVVVVFTFLVVFFVPCQFFLGASLLRDAAKRTDGWLVRRNKEHLLLRHNCIARVGGGVLIGRVVRVCC